MKGKIVLFLDNEGPCTLNDNAQESTVALAKKCGLDENVGANFYKALSNIDDIWGDFHKLPKDPTYSAGHTLKVVLPFFKAMGATSEWLEDFAKSSLRLVPQIRSVLPNLDRAFNTWQISTSYEFFVRAFCKMVEFDFTKARYTAVDRFDAVRITSIERQQLLTFMQQVAVMPVIQYDMVTGEVESKHQEYYDYLTQFIWEKVYKMPVGQFLKTVHPMGQTQKREAIERILYGLNNKPKKCAMYVGDSQTDVQCVEFLRGNGLTMMFNDKGRACEISDLMYIGENARAIEDVACLFTNEGREAVLRYYSPIREMVYGGIIATVTPGNIKELHELSVNKRKILRGVNIGLLT